MTKKTAGQKNYEAIQSARGLGHDWKKLSKEEKDAYEAGAAASGSADSSGSDDPPPETPPDQP